MKILAPRDFAKHVNSTFQVMNDPGGTYPLKLTRLTESKQNPKFQVFSLYFHGSGDRILPQRIYKLNHANLGEIDLFLVPIGKDQDGVTYEAAFDRLVPRKTKKASSNTRGKPRAQKRPTPRVRKTSKARPKKVSNPRRKKQIIRRR
jgi:hypothetical protein